MSHITLDKAAGMAHLVLDAPPMNAMTGEMVDTLGALIAACHDDPEVRALVLRGAGHKAFSAGSDITELRQWVAQGPAALDAKFHRDDRVFSALAHSPKPTFAAIEGVAVGGGLELAACCDFIIAGKSAKFALPEIRLGVFPSSGGTVRVTRRIGAARARRMMWFGDSIDAPTALAWGLIDEMVDDGDALATAQRMAERLAAGPVQAIAWCKTAIEAAVHEGERPALELAMRGALDIGFSADAAEGLLAFEEKRKPVFGRR